MVSKIFSNKELPSNSDPGSHLEVSEDREEDSEELSLGGGGLLTSLTCIMLVTMALAAPRTITSSRVREQFMLLALTRFFVLFLHMLAPAST